MSFTILTIAGKPQRGGDEYYNEQEYADQYDYDEDEEMPINDLDYSNTQVNIRLLELSLGLCKISQCLEKGPY